MAEKMTHAQKFLHDLVISRQLKNWCLERELPHITIYKIAAGNTVPTYAVICQLLPYIPCVDWFFFEDEEIPFLLLSVAISMIILRLVKSMAQQKLLPETSL